MFNIANGMTALMAQTGPIDEVSQIIGIDFFSMVLPWLLTFAIVYGVLSQLGDGDGLPESDAARAVIGIVLAFVIAPVLSPYVIQLAALSTGFVALIAGVILLSIFVQIAGFEGGGGGKKFFGKYPTLTGFTVFVLAVLIFIGSGAHEALGITIPGYISQNYPLLFFLAFMVMIVHWMVKGDEDNKKSGGKPKQQRPKQQN